MKTEDIQKQKAYVANKRSTSNKVVKRSVRRRMNVIENVTVKLVNELRQWVQAIQEKNDLTDTLLPIVCKWTAGQTLSEEEVGVLNEYIKDKGSQPEETAPTAE